MFCPNCKAEYRDGVRRCSDCNVDLGAGVPEEGSKQAFEVLWRGQDPILHDHLCEQLDTADIEYADPPLEVFLRQHADSPNFSFNPRLGLVVSVRTRDLARARAILETLLDRESVDGSLPRAGGRSDTTIRVDESPLPLQWNPLTATVEVWTGHNHNRVHFLAKSLQEVGLPSRTLDGGQTILRLLVRPENEATARELIRQVLEAATPDTSVPQEKGVWYDEPVRSYLFAWLPATLYLGILLLLSNFDASLGETFSRHSRFDPLFSLVGLIIIVGALWMLYQAARYEVRPLRFLVLAFVPLSFLWYYYERYSRRQGDHRRPLAMR